MNWNKLANAYTAQTLCFELGQTRIPKPPPAMDDGQIRYCLNAAKRRNYEYLVLLGIADLESVHSLSKGLGRDQKLVLSDTDLQRGHAFSPGLKDLPQNTALVADTSVWAHILLWIESGINHGNSVVVINPALPPEQKNELKPLAMTWRASRLVPLDSDGRSAPRSLGFGAILSEHEKDLDSFFTAASGLAGKGSIVWDSKKTGNLPEIPGFAHRERSLAGDFSAQRNAMLGGLDSDWVLYLDGDERLDPDLENALPGLMDMGVSGFYFPRFTLFPDRDHFKVGYGLWPDLQLRLFENQPGLKFKNPVHEELDGLCGQRAIVLGRGIIHLQHMLKKKQELAKKLQTFDQASQNTVSHVLSDDYPNLPLDLMASRPGLTSILLLPDTGQPASI